MSNKKTHNWYIYISMAKSGLFGMFYFFFLINVWHWKEWFHTPQTLELEPHQWILFTNPSARAGYDTRSIFKQSLTGLNSEFSFS